MRAKWYIGIISVILILSGLREQQVLPNQEIVFQFADDAKSLSELQNAITIVEDQLNAIGVSNIQIGEANDGTLKITYYSDVDIEGIKNILSKEKHLNLSYTNHQNPTEFPSEEPVNDYNFDVFEIQKNDNIKSDFEGFLAEEKTEYDYFFSSNSLVLSKQFDADYKPDLDADQRSSYEYLAIAKYHLSYQIPEVRAAPSI